MAIWEKAKVAAATPGARVSVDPTGASWVRILSPSFRLNDGADYAIIGHGIQLIFNGVEV